MLEDLKKIKKLYGENMMHLCRDLFPTLLEQEGLLFELLTENFYPSKSLYDDIIEEEQEANFKDYIYGLIEQKNSYKTNISKSPQELLSEAGYYLYECKTEGDIQSFKRYYSHNEALCTFHGGRLNDCYVFFAVKKNASAIKRKNFPNPEREDEYGTSVISIQFSKGKTNTLSIKNRYNHTVNNPDATFSNNLENIIPGLTKSFEKKYGLKINQNKSTGFELINYILAQDGRFYKYNYEIENVYYCPNNIIIDNFDVKKLEPEKNILIDYFILDLQMKEIYLYDESLSDSFIAGIQNIEDIKVIKNKKTSNKEINITTKDNNFITIEINKDNQIITYKNPKLTKVGNYFLQENEILSHLDLPFVEELGNHFLYRNIGLVSFTAPRLKKIGDDFLGLNRNISTLEIPSLQVIGNRFLENNDKLKCFYAPKLMKIGYSFLVSNKILTEFNVPLLYIIGNWVLGENRSLKVLNAPNLVYAGDFFLAENTEMETLELPSLIHVGRSFLECSNLKTLVTPLLKELGDYSLFYNKCLVHFYAPNLCEENINNIELHIKELISKNERKPISSNDAQSNIKKILKKVMPSRDKHL